MTNLEQNEEKSIPEEKEEPSLDEAKIELDIESEEIDMEKSSPTVEEGVESQEALETVPKKEELESEAPDEEEQEVAEEEKVVEESITDSASVSEEVEIEPSDYYKEILEKAEQLVGQTDWAFVSNELANLALHIEEGPDPTSEEASESITKFNAVRNDFEEKKKLHYEELNRKKAENLEAKKDLLQKFTAIITEEKWSYTKEVSQIRGKWDSIKLLPHNEIDALNERFEALLTEFESHKVDRLVKKLQKEEENLTLKLLLLDKIDMLNTALENEKANFKELNKEFQDLLTQWRKVGRVPAEKNQQTWDHFNKSQDAFNELRFKHDKDYRKSVEKSLEKKKKLIKEAEALMDEEDIAIAARQVNKLHNLWKKTGNLHKKKRMSCGMYLNLQQTNSMIKNQRI